MRLVFLLTIFWVFAINYSYSATKAEILAWLDAKDGIMPMQIDSIQYTDVSSWTLNHGDIYQNDGQQVRLYRNQTIVPFNGSRTINQNQWIKIEGILTCGTDDFQVTAGGAGNIIAFCSSMPVIWLLSPTANIKNNQTLVSWSVASQVNNSHFIIEHSSDGRSYIEIGIVLGHGTVSESKHFNYIHETPSIGMNYYRIKQVDYDGKYSYSDIASVRYDGDGETSIYPNPATSEVTITTSEPTSMQVMDVYGRLLINQSISEGQNTINLSELPTGILIFAFGDQKYLVRRM